MIKQLVKKAARTLGYRVVRDTDEAPKLPPEFLSLYEKCRRFTMTSTERMFALHTAVAHVVKHRIPGDIVECGVWRGGSSMMAAHSLAALNDTSRRLYLYDTFAGMSRPTSKDVDVSGKPADSSWEQQQKGGVNTWCYASLDDVRANMSTVPYPQEKITYVQGKVEDTIPGTIPERIALLRLDTDFYESTAHELEHLYPRLSPLGVLILDDYGHWKGAREATDEYFAKHGLKMFLSPIDYTGRLGIKVD